MLSAGLGTILWTSIAFLIMLFILKKMAWKPILQSLKERENFITDSLKSAENANSKLSQLKVENEKLLAKIIKKYKIDVSTKAGQDELYKLVLSLKEK